MKLIKNMLLMFPICTILLGLSVDVHSRVQDSYIFECNEKTSIIGMSESKSNFETNYDTHEGWRSQSSDGSYRVWTVPAGATIRSFDWSCKIHGKDAVIKVWHQSTPKDELIDKYGVQHERCGAFRKLRFTYAGKVILQDILMRDDECDQTPTSRLKTIYFSQTAYLKSSLKNLLGSAFLLEGSGLTVARKKFDYAILINEAITSHVEPNLPKIKSRDSRTLPLPITSNVFNQFLTIQND